MDVAAPALADFARYRVEPDEAFQLAEHDPADTAGLGDEEAVAAQYSGLSEQISELQERLFAEEERALLIVLQGIDAAGKDGTVKHVLRGTNPSGVRVHSFREPTNDEAAHDFLWRYHQATPARGMIGVFNRSHYEDVLVVRVKNLAPESLWRSRFDSINDFERMLVREGTTILKFFLHLSKDEQLEKFRERLEREDKYWKWSDNDMKEREHWDAYQRAYEEAIDGTSTPWAPWYVIPADHRWVRNYVIARVLAGTLSAMNPRFPEPPAEVRRFAQRELGRAR
jgi:PPK2 family polyphosphate:nucleotide phosphotransferase